MKAKTLLSLAIFFMAVCVSMSASAQVELKAWYTEQGIGQEIEVKIPVSVDKDVKFVKSTEAENYFEVLVVDETVAFCYYGIRLVITWNGTSVNGKDIYFVCGDYESPLKSLLINLQSVVVTPSEIWFGAMNPLWGAEISEIESFSFIVKNGNSIDNINSANLNAYIFDGVLNISAENPLGSIALYDINGKCLLNEFAAGSNFTYDVGGLSKGIYIVKVSGVAKKVIVQ